MSGAIPSAMSSGVMRIAFGRNFACPKKNEPDAMNSPKHIRQR